MKNKTLLLTFLLFPLFVWAAPPFDKSETYLITCYDTGTGGIQVDAGQYPLIYNSGADKETDSAFWIITEESAGKYSFKNAETNLYIRYNSERANEKYIEMVPALDGDYTLFTLERDTRHGTSCYAIVSVANPAQYFNKRSYGAVGTYGGSFSLNELFSFTARNQIYYPGEGRLHQYLNFFTLNEKELVPCVRERFYYFSIPLSQMDTDVKRTVRFEKKKDAYKVKINGTEIVSGTEFTFSGVTALKEYNIGIYDGESLLTSEHLIFTGLPIVQLYTEGRQMSGNFAKGKIRVHEPEKSIPSELLHSVMRYRGASAQGYSKKAFAVKLQDAAGESIDRSFFGLRNDNYWILDAMAVDKSRMRNRVSTDLWNDFSSDPYYKAQEKKMLNGTRGQYVELFLDDQYWGLYCMTERIDRKQLKLKKSDEVTQQVNGVLYKATQWSYATMLGYVPGRGPSTTEYLSEPVGNWASWQSFEVKYPDIDDGEKVDWMPLYRFVDFVAKKGSAVFSSQVKSMIDFPVWLDYYLFVELILATDNHGKNVYLYAYDINESEKMGIAPWDLDGVFGTRWNAQNIAAAQDYTNFTIQHEHGEYNIFRRLKGSNVSGFNDQLKKRYDELHQTWFSPESIIGRFEAYKNMFDKSGASTREEKRWNGANGLTINLTNELEYLRQWVKVRTDYLNLQYGPLSGMEEVGTTRQLSASPNPVSDRLYIRDIEPDTPIWVFSETGRCIYSGNSDLTTSIDFSAWTSGRYYLKAGKTGKVIVKR